MVSGPGLTFTSIRGHLLRMSGKYGGVVLEFRTNPDRGRGGF